MFYRRPDSTVRLFASLLLTLWLAQGAAAELPLARLTAAFPPGGRRGTTVQVTVSGQDLDGLTGLRFSDARIVAKPSGANVFAVSVPADLPEGVYDVRVVGKYGISNPRAFVVTSLEEMINKPGNTQPGAAVTLPMGAAISAVAEPKAAQYYRVVVKKGRPIVVAVAASSIDSKFDPSMVLSDAAGRECAVSRRGEAICFTAPADGEYLLNVHDMTYRGGAEFFYRLTTTEGDSGEKERPFDYCPSIAAFLDTIDDRLRAGSTGASLVAAHAPSSRFQKLEISCDVTGRFAPRGGLSRFTFDAPAGAKLAIEVFSHRLGHPTSPFFLLQRVTLDDRGVEKVADVREVYESPANLGGVEFDTASHDPACTLDVKEAGRYRVTLRNLFTTGGDAAVLPYRLSIRNALPDFRLVAFAASPIAEKDSKDVPLWSLLLRRGGVTPIKVVAQRRDGFAGEIQLNVAGLPPGVTCEAASIAPGATSALLLLRAAPTAAPSIAPLTVSGTANMEGVAVTRRARPGTVATSSYDGGPKTLEISSRCARDLPVAVSGELTPLSIIALQPAIETSVFGKVALPFQLVRRDTFTAPIPLRLVGHPLLAPLKEVEAAATADSASIDLDLAQIKLPAGEYDFHVQTLAKLKYAARGKDVSASFYSTPVHLVVTPAPITLAPVADVTVAAGGKAELTASVTRLYKYTDPIDLALVAPNVKGLSGKGTIAKDQTQGKISITADAASPAGKHAVKLQATLKLNGQTIVVEELLNVTITGKPATK
jgi:hypothetical protein